jgi:hypothetical protein
MYLIYSDDKNYSRTSGTNFWEMDGVKHYITHYDNFLYLKFVMNNPAATRIEKIQAEKELTKASKKCDFWLLVAKRQNRISELTKKEQELRKKWNVSG